MEKLAMKKDSAFKKEQAANAIAIFYTMERTVKIVTIKRISINKLNSKI